MGSEQNVLNKHNTFNGAYNHAVFKEIEPPGFKFESESEILESNYFYGLRIRNMSRIYPGFRTSHLINSM